MSAELGDSRLPERFWDKVEEDSGGCWVWTAGLNTHGYGQFRLGDGQCSRGSHRIAYTALVGSVAEGLQLDHLCRIRNCVNPSHLEQVTHRENLRRGDSPTARNARKTTCFRGHDFDKENTYVRKGGGRRCRACRRGDRWSRR